MAAEMSADLAGFAGLLDRPHWNVTIRLDASLVGLPHNFVRRVLINPRGPMSCIDDAVDDLMRHAGLGNWRQRTTLEMHVPQRLRADLPPGVEPVVDGCGGRRLVASRVSFLALIPPPSGRNMV